MWTEKNIIAFEKQDSVVIGIGYVIGISKHWPERRSQHLKGSGIARSSDTWGP